MREVSFVLYLVFFLYMREKYSAAQPKILITYPIPTYIPAATRCYAKNSILRNLMPTNILLLMHFFTYLNQSGFSFARVGVLLFVIVKGEAKNKNNQITERYCFVSLSLVSLTVKVFLKVPIGESSVVWKIKFQKNTFVFVSFLSPFSAAVLFCIVRVDLISWDRLVRLMVLFVMTFTLWSFSIFNQLKMFFTVLGKKDSNYRLLRVTACACQCILSFLLANMVGVNEYLLTRPSPNLTSFSKNLACDRILKFIFIFLSCIHNL